MPNTHSPHSVSGPDYRKRASPPDSKVSYHSHYLDNDGSPESLALDQNAGRKLQATTSHRLKEDATDQERSQSSRLQNLALHTSKHQKDMNLRIDVDAHQGRLPASILNESCKTHLSNKNLMIGGTKYINLDPFADRKHSTRTDVDIRKFHSSLYKEDMRAEFRQGLNGSSSITPKLGFYSIEEDEGRAKPRKIKIVTSKSSNRIRASGSSRRHKEKQIVNKI